MLNQLLHKMFQTNWFHILNGIEIIAKLEKIYFLNSLKYILTFSENQINSNDLDYCLILYTKQFYYQTQ